MRGTRAPRDHGRFSHPQGPGWNTVVYHTVHHTNQFIYICVNVIEDTLARLLFAFSLAGELGLNTVFSFEVRTRTRQVWFLIYVFNYELVAGVRMGCKTFQFQ